MKSLFIVFSVVLLELVVGSPLDTGRSGLSEKEQNYLIRYGYLDEYGVKSQEQIQEAIETFQRFMSLPVTGIIDEATKKIMQAPRCGHPDIIKNKSRFTIRNPWTKKDISYFVQNVSAKLDGDVERVATILQTALDKWAPWGELTFTRKHDLSADMIAYFATGDHGDGYPFDGQGTVLAHAFFPGDGIGGDIHYDDDESWVWPENIDNGIEIYSVSIHELGHSLGMGHSDVQSAIMFPIYQKVPLDRDLDYDDILGMYELYLKNPIN